MKALVLNKYDGPRALQLQEVPTPKPKPGQVLIKVFAAPVNPSDLSYLDGDYGIKKKLPKAGGMVGAGQVVETGSGAITRFMKNKRVAFSSLLSEHGTWAQYTLADAKQCIVLKKNISYEKGANMIVNPLTVMAFLEIVKERNIKAIVHTAAASALGIMLEREARTRNIRVINIVRRQEQVDLLKKEGAEHVLNSSLKDFDRKLKVLCGKLNANLAFDAVAGKLTLVLMQNMPAQSHIIVYGGLSGEACQTHPGDLIFRNSVLEGFWLTSWLSTRSLLKTLSLARKVQARLGTTLATDVSQQLGLSEARAGIIHYKKNMTGSKILITPFD